MSKTQQAGQTKIKLSRPLDIDGSKISELTMREPTVGDQMAADEFAGSNAAKEVFLIANLCGIAPDDVKKMPLRDYKKVQDTFLGFTN